MRRVPSTSLRTNGRSGGFTLLEVMIALGILVAGLATLVGGNLRNARKTREVRMMTIATALTRGKMYDLEEQLAFKGFQETEENFDGKFDEEGYPLIAWEAKIEKVEIPGAQALAQGDTADGEAGASSGGFGGGSGLTATAGFGMLSSQFGLIQQVLEQAIRKVTLKVSWKLGKEEQEIVVVCYYTNPKAVDQAVSGLPDPGALTGGSSPGGTSPGGTSPRGTSGTNPPGQNGGRR